MSDKLLDACQAAYLHQWREPCAFDRHLTNQLADALRDAMGNQGFQNWQLAAAKDATIRS